MGTSREEPTSSIGTIFFVVPRKAMASLEQANRNSNIPTKEVVWENVSTSVSSISEKELLLNCIDLMIESYSIGEACERVKLEEPKIIQFNFQEPAVGTPPVERCIVGLMNVKYLSLDYFNDIEMVPTVCIRGTQ